MAGERLASVGEPGGAHDADLQAALALHRSGQIAEAAAQYRKLLASSPDHPQVLHLLGVAETESGHPERGIELIGRAIAAFAGKPGLHIDLGNAYRVIGKRDEAVASYRRALALEPDYALAHICLGSVLGEMGRFEAAISHCRAAIAIEPDSLPARIALAGALQGAGRLPEAAQTWREIIKLDPNRAASYHQLAGQLLALGLFREALFCNNRSIALEPANSSYHCARGYSLMRLYRGDEAQTSFRRAVELAPDSKEAWAGLSWALRLLGRFDEADRCLERLRELDPTDLRDVRHIPSTGGQAQEPSEIARLVDVLARHDTRDQDRITAGFALGRLLDEAGRYDEAFARYESANALMRRTWPASGDRFDARTFGRSVDRLIATNTPEYLTEAVSVGNMSEMPVFVVGMPRSGTTLVEQICATHSRIFGAGERDDISRIAVALARDRNDPAKLAATSRRVADAHIVELHRLGGGALRVIDKLPDNIVLVGLIARLFPRARFIYCSRDARDIALSCYFQLFADGAQYFAYDLADCGHRCRDVRRLAAHWLKLLPWHMIEVNYEALVADLEGESRRMIEFLGLDWEPQCLDFHRTERTVATVSHWQVRQPIYATSIGRWRHYEKYLEPLFAALRSPDDIGLHDRKTEPCGARS